MSMRNLFCIMAALSLAAAPAAAQEELLDGTDWASDDEMDDLDDLFADAEDVEISAEEEARQQSQPVTLTSIVNNDKITFSGSVSASLGYFLKLEDDGGGAYGRDGTPYATFENYLRFTARPSGVLSVKGSLYTAFPSNTISLNTLYFDYIMFGKVYITAGFTGTSWGNSEIFDTNVLDDGNITYSSHTSVLDSSSSTAHFFDAIFTIPFRRGQFQAVGIYSNNSGTLNPDYMSYAASIEYPFWGWNFNLFARRWATGDTNRMEPATGLEITGDVRDFHVTLWGKAHTPWRGGEGSLADRITYAKFVGGIGRKWDEFPKMGFLVEYQAIYDPSSSTGDDVFQAIAFKWTWKDIAAKPLQLALQWYHGFNGTNGEILPSVSYTGIPHAKLSIVAPIFYGEQTTTYNTVSVSSTKERPTILLGAVLTLSADY